MKRDLDLIREILLNIEAYNDNKPLTDLKIKEYPKEEIAYNVYLLENAGLIEGKIYFGLGTVLPEGYAIFRMTWAGHDFLEACRDESRWIQAKEIIKKLGEGVTFDVVKQILVHLLMDAVSTYLKGGGIGA
jgi:hypothetical protein